MNYTFGKKRKNNKKIKKNDKKEIEKMTTGERIVTLLRKQGLSQKQLAERIGVTEATISRYMTGDRTPKSSILANIATALHTTSDYLLGNEEDGNIEKDYPQICRLIARNANKMTKSQKKELLNVLFNEE
jgi:transcriptional regulator with XRE-family HTH domain|nr:MAG TPA: helix-turn-helix domain protein [Caudoviricetes sp.]